MIAKISHGGFLRGPMFTRLLGLTFHNQCVAAHCLNNEHREFYGSVMTDVAMTVRCGRSEFLTPGLKHFESQRINHLQLDIYKY